ncbi:uncharacterized protein LOC142794513 [Rhipicephalus microplus]|uniref:uncharacterized protein LOC142794513 n=1 Tax=Rhipicephalus microplus TaxID=6941 RepID=UPI003F6CC799
MEEDDDSYDSIEEDDDSDSSVDLVSILKVKTPEQPQPVDKTWSALLVGSGVLLAVVAVGTLFFLTAMGFKTSNSHGVKTGVLRSGGGGGNGARHGAGTSEHSVSATQSTTRVRHVSVVHVTRHTGAGQLGNDSSDIAGNASDSSTDSTDKTKAWSKATSSASSSRSGRITTSSTGGVRTHANVTTSKRPSSVPTASTRKPITKTPLVCVFGNRIDWKMHFPDDGLCDFVFYDSLYGHPDNRFQADVYNFTADLRRWLAAAATYDVSEGGLAVASTSVDQARRDVSSAKGKATVKKLRASGVQHYGVLDFVATNKTKDRDVKATFDLLKELKKLLIGYLSKNESFDHHLAVGITYFKDVNQEIYRSIEKAISEEAIPLLILRTHLGSRDDVGSKHCRITGSTVWGKPDAEQQPSMVSLAVCVGGGGGAQ